MTEPARSRIPPGQVETTKWPVLHYGDVPTVDTSKWTFMVSGLVENPFTLSYDEFLKLPRKTVNCDIHCVTTWSRLDNTFEGVSVQLLLERAKLKPEAKYCLVVAEQGFTTNLPLSDLNRPENLIALKWAGEPLTPEHGWPARLLVPHLYFWKSAKWVRGFELLDEDLPGFWEQNGYHMHGDPWTEERYGGRGLTQHEINKFRNASKRIAKCPPPRGTALGSAAPRLSQQLVEGPEHLDSIPQLLQLQLLIGCVQPVIRQSDSRQDHGRASRGESRDDRDRSARARRHRPTPQHLLERLIEQLERWIVQLDLRRIRTVEKPDTYGYVLRREALQGSFELSLHGLELLIGHEPHADFGGRLGRNHGLGSLARESAEDAVNLERRQRPEPL